MCIHIDQDHTDALFKGIATRTCNNSGQWAEPDLSNCLTRVGEELQLIVSQLLH